MGKLTNKLAERKRTWWAKMTPEERAAFVAARAEKAAIERATRIPFKAVPG